MGKKRDPAGKGQEGLLQGFLGALAVFLAAKADAWMPGSSEVVGFGVVGLGAMLASWIRDKLS
jgi:hypothetical protein